MTKNEMHHNELAEAMVAIIEDACRNRGTPAVIGGAALLAAAITVFQRAGKTGPDIAGFIRDEATKLESYAAAGATNTAA